MAAGTMLMAWRKKSRTDTTVRRQEAGQYSRQVLRLVPAVPRVKAYNKDDPYLFPLPKMLAVPWDQVEQAGLLQSPGPISNLLLVASLPGSAASSDGRREQARNRNALIQGWSPAYSEVLSK